MANKYEVTLTNGQVYDVTIAKHHDDYTQNVWLGDLVDVLKTIVANVATHHISYYSFRAMRSSDPFCALDIDHDTY